MASGSASATGLALANRGRDLILPLAIVASVLVILVPLPAGMMDVLLAANITVAVVVLLTTIYVRSPIEFSVFPTLLLATTLSRLVLNIAITRLILTRADSDGLYAAGHVVSSFSNFVTGGGNVAVGLIIFAIIAVVQFVVITKGATRISEVAARFALDGMPGKQMAIDADLAAGAIDGAEARRRRAEVAEQADFYGAMDGASKFVRGDAIAAVVITLVNIVGGLFIGVIQQGMPLSQAASLFTRLTIGDGLVSQVPALLISLAAGLLITRSARSNNLPQQFLQQLFGRPQALAIAGGFLALLVFTSLPAIPLLTLGGACFGLSWIVTRQQAGEAAAIETANKKQTPPPERLEDFLTVDPIQLELGLDLLRLADNQLGGGLLHHVGQIRRRIAAELGFIMPKVRLRDNLELGRNEYRIKLFDMPVSQGTVPKEELAGLDGIHHLAARLTEVCRSHAAELLTRDATQGLLDELKKTSPAVVEEVVPKLLTLAEVQAVLQRLLAEQVSIRQLGIILETLGNHATDSKEPTQLVEWVRGRLARQISAKYRDAAEEIHVVTLDPDWESRIHEGIEPDASETTVRIAPTVADRLCNEIGLAVDRLAEAGRPAIVLVSPVIRQAVRQITEHALPHLVVLSFHEITRDTNILNLATVGERFETVAPDQQFMRQAS